MYEVEGPTGDALAAEPTAVVGIGLCVVDVASAQVIVGQFNDDEVCIVSCQWYVARYNKQCW